MFDLNYKFLMGASLLALAKSIYYYCSECRTLELCLIDTVLASRITKKVGVGITFKVT